MIKYDVRFDMPVGKTSLVFFVNTCNMRCHYCDYHKVLKYINTSTEIDEIETVIQNHLPFIRNIAISGGEPLLFRNIVYLLFDLANRHNLTFTIYTNLLLGHQYIDIIRYSNVIVDVKGCTAEEIVRNTKIDYTMAKQLYKNYIDLSKYVNEWRVNENIDIDRFMKIVNCNITKYKIL